MKKVTQFLSAAAFVITMAAGSLASAWPAQFVGTWRNVNPNSRGIVRLEISSGMQLRAFGACTPTPCNHGLTPMATYGTSVTNANHRAATAHYNFAFKQVGMTMKLSGAWHMNMEHWNMFTDSSGRHNYWMGERFRKLTAVEAAIDFPSVESEPMN